MQQILSSVTLTTDGDANISDVLTGLHRAQFILVDLVIEDIGTSTTAVVLEMQSSNAVDGAKAPTRWSKVQLGTHLLGVETLYTNAITKPSVAGNYSFAIPWRMWKACRFRASTTAGSGGIISLYASGAESPRGR